MENTGFVKDIHGHVYPYIELYHSERIGTLLQFCESPVTPASTVKLGRARTMQELRELALKEGLDIPADTPFAKAQNMYIAHMADDTTDSELEKLAGGDADLTPN